nr:MAG TPA: major capsid protein [Caudoviricetes sp.]
MANEARTLFQPELVADLLNKVKGKSTLAKLSGQIPISFVGNEMMTFSMDNEVDVVAENGKKTEGGIKFEPVKMIPIKLEYGARISDEFLYASEEKQLDVLRVFNDGFSAKVARGLDICAFHGLNPRTKTASTVIGTNNFDSLVSQQVTYAAANADDNLDAAIALVDGSEGDVTGFAFSKTFGAAMSKIKANGITLYPEFRFGGNPEAFAGRMSDTNNTVNFATSKVHAYVGDFANAFKWGIAKEIPLEVIQYGDPDNSGKDLKGYNQVYLRTEIYIGWGILAPEFFARITEA